MRADDSEQPHPRPHNYALRNVPDEVAYWIGQYTKVDRRSINQEIIFMLTAYVEQRRAREQEEQVEEQHGD